MPDFLPPKVVGVQQRPLYLRVRSILTIFSALWLISAIIGLGFFSGGTTSLAFSLILLYGTGAALLVVISAIYRAVSRAARQRVETAPDDNAATVFVDTTRSATEEIMAALRPAAPSGRPAAAVRMPQSVDALDVAAALAARTAAMTRTAAAEKAAAASAAMVAPGKTTVGKSAVNKSANKKKASPKQGTQTKKVQTGKTRPANNAGSRGTAAPAGPTSKKSTGGKKPGAAGKGSAAGKGATVPGQGPAAADGGKVEKTPAPSQFLTVPGFRTAEQDILPRRTDAPACGLGSRPETAVRKPNRDLAVAA